MPRRAGVATPIPLPANLREPLALADWMELCALTESDGSVSKSSLEAILLRSATARDGESAERQALEVFRELERRVRVGGDSYPFKLELPVLNRRVAIGRQHSPYRFCLALSYYGWKPVRNAPVNPWLLFEYVSAHAAAQCFCSIVVIFGTSARAEDGNSFGARITQLAEAMGEGRGFRPQDTMSAKDDHVDLVAIRKVDGERKANLIIFGQCAAGQDWKHKDSELDANAFFGQWFLDAKVSHLGHSFFVPHCFIDSRFEHAGRRAGVLFDRLRVARWASTHTLDDELVRRMDEWFSEAVRRGQMSMT